MILGFLLAGGLGRRIGGGDKPLRLLAGRPLLDHAIERLAPQVDRLALNANGDPERFARYGLPIVADDVPGFAGPLAGILAGLDWAAARLPSCHQMVSVPTDAPFLPRDLVGRLAAAAAAEGKELACAASGGRAHPVVALWPVRLREALRRALVDEGIRKVDSWTARYGVAEAAFPKQPLDPFFNINRAEDLAAAEILASQG